MFDDDQQKKYIYIQMKEKFSKKKEEKKYGIFVLDLMLSVPFFFSFFFFYVDSVFRCGGKIARTAPLQAVKDEKLLFLSHTHTAYS